MAGAGRRTARSRASSSRDEDDAKPNLRPPRGRGRNHTSIGTFNVDLRVLLGLSVIAFVAILFLIYNLINPIEQAQTPRVVTPFPAPKLMDLPQV